MPVALWTSPAFVEEARAWTAEQLGEESLTGEWEQPHARPWSSAIRFTTSRGRAWFKVNGPGTTYEGRLTRLLGDLVPELVPQVLALDDARGWTLLRDAGPTLRATWPPEELWGRWEDLLARYAEAQRVLAGHGQEVLATGVPDQRPSLLPGHLVATVDRLSGLPVGDGGLSAAETRRLEAVVEECTAWCAELDASGVAPSVNHDDLHSSNVCLPPGATVAAARVIDWGDTVWSHPFATLLATLNSIAFHAGTEVTDPRVRRVRDAYLAVHADHGSAPERERWVRLARRAGCVTKAMSYVRAFEGEPASAEAAEGWPVRAWLLETLDPGTDG